MDIAKEIKELEEEIKLSLPHISVDCVIIGYMNQDLKLLILNWSNTNRKTVPGGFVRKSEDLYSAASRILKSRTGYTFPFLHELGAFSDPNRRDVETLIHELQQMDLVGQEMLDWFKQRFISIAYFTLIDPLQYNFGTGYINTQMEWVSLKNLPALTFDHQKMVQGALEYLRKQIFHDPLCQYLLPKKFTMKTLQELYETILGKSLDRGNFQKRMLKSEMLIRLEKEMTGAANKAPYLYRFKT